VVVVLVLFTSGCWWAQPGFGPERTFANPGEQRLTAGTIDGVVELWTGFLGQAVVAGDTIYSSADGGVSARNARTGAVRWRQALPLTQVSAPVLHDGVVYVSGFDVQQVCQITPFPICGNIASNIGVRRYDAATGAPQPMLPWAGTTDGPTGPMAAAGDHLVTPQGWFPPRLSPGISDPNAYRVFDLTGATPDGFVAPASAVGLLPPVLDPGRGQVLAGSAAGVEAFELGSCSPCTRRWASTEPATAVALSGDTVVVASGTGEIRLLDAATGAPTASALVDFGAAQLAVSGDTIVARAPQRLWAFDGCASLECPRSWVSSVRAYGQPVIAGELVYVNSAADPAAEGTTLDVYRLDGCGRPTCAPIARLDHPADTTGAVVSGGLIVTQDAVLGLPG
jgi:outer membrane protein assembly factor BamB